VDHVQATSVIRGSTVVESSDNPPAREGSDPSPADRPFRPSKSSLQEALDRVEREMIVEALQAARGNKAKAARALGITERVMGLRVQKHGIDPRMFRTDK
jgi:DNA-binding NtrC family response regulator